ncbi:ABC transporter permease [Mariprofundus ferrooxydans]|nr:ABC transporter permease [Mariprofundus ferrooxydans]
MNLKWKGGSLLSQMIWREVLGRYRGSVIGLMWSFLHPLLMLAVYAFVFGVVLPARWPSADTPGDFALNLFAGLIVYGLFSECVNRAPDLVLNNVNYVKKVVFPLHFLPISVLVSALFHSLVSLFILLLFFMFLHGLPYLTVLWVPVIWLPFILFTIGLSWVLASLGVYLRDIAQVVGVTTTALLFLSPVFYPASALPEALQGWMFLNPLALVIEQTRSAVLQGVSPNWQAWGIYMVVGLITAWLGYLWFIKTRKGFSDVL